RRIVAAGIAVAHIVRKHDHDVRRTRRCRRTHHRLQTTGEYHRAQGIQSNPHARESYRQVLNGRYHAKTSIVPARMICKTSFLAASQFASVILSSEVSNSALANIHTLGFFAWLRMKGGANGCGLAEPLEVLSGRLSVIRFPVSDIALT